MGTGPDKSFSIPRTPKRTHRVTTLLDDDTFRGFKGLARRKKATRSTVLYHLIQNTLEAEERENTTGGPRPAA